MLHKPRIAGEHDGPKWEGYGFGTAIFLRQIIVRWNSMRDTEYLLLTFTRSTRSDTYPGRRSTAELPHFVIIRHHARRVTPESQHQVETAILGNSGGDHAW